MIDYSKGGYILKTLDGGYFGRIDGDEFVRNSSSLFYRIDGDEFYEAGGAVYWIHQRWCCPNTKR